MNEYKLKDLNLKIGGIYILKTYENIDFILFIINKDFCYIQHLYEFYTKKHIDINNKNKTIDNVENKKINEIIIKYKQSINPRLFYNINDLTTFEQVSYLGQLEEFSYEKLLIIFNNVFSIKIPNTLTFKIPNINL